MTEMVQSADQLRDMPAAQPVAAPAVSPQNEPSQGGLAHWIHQHPKFTKEPVSYLGYQFFRSAIAAIPYGFAMAGVHHLFGWLSAVGQRKGLNEAGINAFTDAVKNGKSGIAAVDGIEKFYSRERGAIFGRNLMRLSHSPFNPAMQIAAGFTLFRFTGGLIKTVRDRITDEKNTEAKTAQEIKDIPNTLYQNAKINWPAESTATPIAALVLGFMNASFTPALAGSTVRKEGKSFLSEVKRVWSPDAKLFQNAAIWTASYSLFFLLSETLFKDTLLRQGLWRGHPNSLKNGPDDIVGGPAAVKYTPPDADENDPDSPHHHKHKHPHAKASDILKAPYFTEDPSIGRFVLRRVLPVAVGISAYAAMKRVGYLAAGGPMKPFTVPFIESGAKANWQQFRQNAFREGLATSTFGVVWVAADAWASWYDKFFNDLQHKGEVQILTPEQQKHHAALLERLNAKEQSAGRAA